MAHWICIDIARFDSRSLTLREVSTPSNSFPIQAPFQRREERFLILVVVLSLFTLPVIFSYVENPRLWLLSRIPETEASAKFITAELFKSEGDIDLLMTGPCTIWWQLYTPWIKEGIEGKLGRTATVLTFGHNHYGPDISRILLEEILQRRKVRFLLLPLPKAYQNDPFPHPQSHYWWNYPRDLEDLSPIPFKFHLQLFGSTVFFSPSRWLVRGKESGEVANHSFGFNTERTSNSDVFLEFQAAQKYLKQAEPPHTMTLKDAPEAAPTGHLNVWQTQYQRIAELTREHDVKVFFIDTPNNSDSNEFDETPDWNFKRHFPSETPVIRLDIKKWLAGFPAEKVPSIYLGRNLTGLGALLFTRSVENSIAEVIQ